MNKLIPKILIVGLRRCGSTAFWQALRRDSRLCCYDEPFNPQLKDLPCQNTKGTRDELIALYSNDPGTFLYYFTPITLADETIADMTSAQMKFLYWILDHRQHRLGVVIDSTRVVFKLSRVFECASNSILIHLYRTPKTWISSHLLPSGKGTWRKPFANVYRRMSFWTRKGFYSNWGYQEIIEREIAHGSYWAGVKMGTEQLQGKSAIIKLAAFYRWAFNEAEIRGKKLWGYRFLSISFEDFCENPRNVLAKVYTAAELEMPKMDYSFIRKANQGFKSEFQRWNDVFKAAGYEPNNSD